jgi:hypothetical protein
MNRRSRTFQFALVAGSLLLLLSLAGCYHATITTGLPAAGAPKVTWAHSWVYGLVPPAVVQAESECANGVAQVETHHTFVNQLVGALTWGIYTPITITVTCAAAGTGAQPDDSASVTVEYGSDHSAVMGAFAAASDRAVQEHQPVYVVFREGAAE